MVTTGTIAAANAHIEQGIPAENHAISYKANAASAVAGGVQHLKLQVSNREKIAIFEQSVRARWLFEGRINSGELAEVITLQGFGFGCMDGKAGSSRFYDGANGSNVIRVSMGSHYEADLET